MSAAVDRADRMCWGAAFRAASAQETCKPDAAQRLAGLRMTGFVGTIETEDIGSERIAARISARSSKETVLAAACVGGNPAKQRIAVSDTVP